MDSPYLLPLLLLVFLAAMAPSPATPSLIRLPSTGRDRAEACAAQHDPAVYDRPVIGVVTHPGDGTYEMRTHGSGSYIAASYVKFVESAGARVVPLVYDEPEERLLEVRAELASCLSFCCQYFPPSLIVHAFFAQYVLDRNDAGDPFTLHAECLGFELVSMIVSKFPNYKILQGSVFERFSPDLIKKLSTNCLVMQNHRVYVSTVQADRYPITCTQWHPEIYSSSLPFFDGGHNGNGSKTQVRFMLIYNVSLISNFTLTWISQARKSLNRPTGDKVRNNLIDNYSPKFRTS
ncbi:hypothetical protein HU200_023951 [Digitaria exilis]|uniref:Folate gamma-glutamyl hydrolase n=1 Tax=Digitaria exilis TaxID=1010633 RepID=A0A835EWM2_9POAL|nr:hypothetical protein HU200_023951 [Digitaria exilis]